MRIVHDHITLQEIKDMAKNSFGDLVKGVVDVKKGVMALDGELHADEEQLLLQDGSDQNDCWGINIYPDLPYPERIEFDSMINVRPTKGNMTRGIEDKTLRETIITIVKRIVTG